MTALFYIAAVVAVLATALAITRLNAVHALLYAIVSFLAMSLILLTLGAPFIAALEVIIYAGAIMVLFLFAVMMLNQGPQSVDWERQLFSPGLWRGPAVLAGVLFVELVYVLSNSGPGTTGAGLVSPKQLGLTLFGPYVLGVELTSLLLTACLVGAFHLGRRDSEAESDARFQVESKHNVQPPTDERQLETVAAGEAPKH